MSVKRTIGYVGPDPRKKVYHRPYGRLVGGTAIGIMRIGSSCVIYLPGNVSNASTYDFPVRYVFTEGTTQDNIHRGDPSVLPNLIATARQLESEGCRAIFASCGYFGHFQREVSEAVDVPVFLSSVMQLPFAFAGLSPKKKIGILCGDGANLNDHLFQACGVSKELQDRCVITGMEGLPEFKDRKSVV